MRTTNEGGESRHGAMTAAVNDGTAASAYLTRAENLIAKQKGRTVDSVRPAIAAGLKITVSAAHFIRRGRRKVVPSWLKQNIIALFIKAAQDELAAITHEIEVARQIGLGNGDDALIEAKARAAALIGLLDNVSSEGARQISIGGGH